MATNKTDDNKKFLQVTHPLSFGTKVSEKPCKKRRVRRIAEPHIEPYKAKGYVYYRYRRGTDPPEHLGSADFIRKAVTQYRKESQTESNN